LSHWFEGGDPSPLHGVASASLRCVPDSVTRVSNMQSLGPAAGGGGLLPDPNQWPTKLPSVPPMIGSQSLTPSQRDAPLTTSESA
jgi:hypothetical protein